MAEDVKAGKGRKDEVGHTGVYPATGPYPEKDAEIITPSEINQGPSVHDGPGVERNEALKGTQRQPRLGNEEDKPDSDALVPWNRDDLHKPRSAAPGWQGAKSEHIAHM